MFVEVFDCGQHDVPIVFEFTQACIACDTKESANDPSFMIMVHCERLYLSIPCVGFRLPANSTKAVLGEKQIAVLFAINAELSFSLSIPKIFSSD